MRSGTPEMTHVHWSVMGVLPMPFSKVAAPTPEIVSNSSNARKLLDITLISRDALGIRRLGTSQG